MSLSGTPARWTRTAQLLAALTACGALLAACAPTTRVVQLPDSGGMSTAGRKGSFLGPSIIIRLYPSQ